MMEMNRLFAVYGQVAGELEDAQREVRGGYFACGGGFLLTVLPEGFRKGPSLD
jgi:hypothetical protein